MLKVGVVGCGGMGLWHLKKYSELSGVKIVAVCEINDGSNLFFGKKGKRGNS